MLRLIPNSIEIVVKCFEIAIGILRVQTDVLPYVGKMTITLWTHNTQYFLICFLIISLGAGSTQEDIGWI